MINNNDENAFLGSSGIALSFYPHIERRYNFKFFTTIVSEFVWDRSSCRQQGLKSEQKGYPVKQTRWINPFKPLLSNAGAWRND